MLRGLAIQRLSRPARRLLSRGSQRLPRRTAAYPPSTSLRRLADCSRCDFHSFHTARATILALCPVPNRRVKWLLPTILTTDTRGGGGVFLFHNSLCACVTPARTLATSSPRYNSC